MYPNGVKIPTDVLELAARQRPLWGEMSAQIATSGVPTNDGTATLSAKDKLKRIESEQAEVRDELPKLREARDDARQAFASSDAMSQDSPEFKAAEEAQRALGSAEDRLSDLSGMQVSMLKMLGQDAPAPSRQNRPAGDPSDPRGDGSWSTKALLQDEDLQRQLEHAAKTKGRSGPIELGEVASRDQLVADVTGTTAMRKGSYLGVLPQLRRQLRLLDLIPTGSMDQNTLPYTQESGSFATAAETAEGGLKPEAAVTFTDAEASARTIAHWMKLRKQALADFPALQSMVDGRLRYGVEQRLEAEIIAGNGSGENITGILNTSGLGAVAYAADTLITDQVLKAITTVYLAQAQANAIVMHPTDWQTALIAKAGDTGDSGDGQYYSGGPFSVTPLVMWGVPVIPSAAVAAGTVLVGDFAIGAQLFIREGVSVLLSDSDQDDFVKNRVTLLAEMRAALAVFRPAAFCTVDLTA